MKGLTVLLNPRLHYTSLVQSIAVLFQYRQLIYEMTKAEISTRYVGQALGAVWAIVHPVFLVTVYVFVFSYVFKAKMGGTVDLPLNYTAYLLSGLIPWLALQESMGKSPGVILNNPNLVKQMVFPIEVLPIKDVLASSITLLIALLLMILYVLVSHGSLLMTYFLLPLLIILQILGMIGLCYILSSIGVYFRDLQNFVEAFLRIGVFTVPVLFLPASMPASLKVILHLNPFSYMVWCYQDALYFGRFEHPWAWPIYIGLCVGGFYAGYRIFNKLKLGMGEML